MASIIRDNSSFKLNLVENCRTSFSHYSLCMTVICIFGFCASKNRESMRAAYSLVKACL
jgi:hypothetical protein